MIRIPIMRLLKLPEAAPRLGVSVDTLRRWIKKGRISAIHYGGNTPYMIDDEVVDRFKEAHTTKVKEKKIKKYKTLPVVVSEMTIPREQWGSSNV